LLSVRLPCSCVNILHCAPACPLAQAQQEAQRLAASLAAELATLDRQLAPLLLPALQAYAHAAAAAPTSRTVGERDWQGAQASACSDALQLFVTAGALAAAAGATGGSAAAALAAWMGGGGGRGGEKGGEEVGEDGTHGPPAWRLLSQLVAGTLRAADRAFLLAAVDRANAAMDATGALPARLRFCCLLLQLGRKTCLSAVCLRAAPLLSSLLCGFQARALGSRCMIRLRLFMRLCIHQHQLCMQCPALLQGWMPWAPCWR
jgi:hypothetical protein